MRSVLITGKSGMLGRYLTRNLPFDIIHSPKRIDITNKQECRRLMSSLPKIDFLVNCSAFTDTNECNTNEGMIESFRINCLGPKNLSKICRDLGIHLVHISTDYVHSEYSTMENPEFPINVYGCHKLLGEKYIREIFEDKTQYSILRCSWLYGFTDRKKNFVDKIVDFCRNSKDGTIKVVDDCFGRPSSVEYVSKFIEQCLRQDQWGTIDAQVNANPISRFEFAKMIVRNLNLNIEVVPAKSDYFKNQINQPKTVPLEFTDESSKFKGITKAIEHSSEYEYWLKRYLEERYD